VAVDLRATAGSRSTLDDFVASAADQLDEAGFDEAIVVAHSLGGITARALCGRHPERVAHLIFVACAVPGPDLPVVTGFPPPFSSFARFWYRRAERNGHTPLPRFGARLMYCHGLSREDQEFVFERRVGEAPRVLLDPVPGVALPADLPITWIRLRHDRGVPPRWQDRMRANVGRPVEVVELDAPHMVMLSDPALLADVLNSRT
jgi:pimeloyl-ACP methyl ester carboxylesterase